MGIQTERADLLLVINFLKTEPTETEASEKIREFMTKYDMDFKEFCIQLWDLEERT